MSILFCFLTVKDDPGISNRTSGLRQTCRTEMSYEMKPTICGYFSGSVTLMSVSLMFRY